MHRARTSKTTQRRSPGSTRRGSVLILVVGVLVLLAISAAVYVGVGQQERRAAAASEMKSNRDSVISKVVDYLGQILVRDLFGNDAQATRPFQDSISSLGFDNLIMGERWDYPYTRPGNSSQFNVLADAWLASIEPVGSIATGNGEWNIWPHISNVHPQGKFVSIGKFFTGSSINGGAFYADLTIGGGNSRPYDLDTFTGGPEFDYTKQISALGASIGETNDETVTWADRWAGADTDGDGRIDARWTELPDVTGQSKMRFFEAVRIVDASAMFNVNANFELGASADNESTSKVGLGRTPADVDLYTYLFDGFQTWGGPNDDPVFVNGATPGRLGFKQHIYQTGIQDAFLGSDYKFNARSTRVERETFWSTYARNAYRPGANLSPYGVADEMAIRRFLFTVNDASSAIVSPDSTPHKLRRAGSRFEMAFEGLNIDPIDQNTWFSPLRTRYRSTELVNYSQGTPTTLMLQADSRHLLTTYNGSMPIRPWSRGYSASDSPSVSFNLNSLMASNDPATPQTLTGGYMWALAPYATDIGNPNGADSGLNLFGSPVAWMPPNNQQLHYGDGDAGYAFYKAATSAVNAMDYFDSNDEPTIRTLRFNRNLSAPDRGDREIVGTFDHGKVPTQMVGPSGSQNDATVTLIGMERQPFIREVSAVNVYGNFDDNGFWDWSEDRGEWMVKILAIELGNPWPDAISTSGYRLRYGDNSWSVPTATIPRGESIVFYIGGDNPDNGVQPGGTSSWSDYVQGATRGAGLVVEIPGGFGALDFEPSGGGTPYQEVTLWRTASYGETINQVLVDRIRPATPNDDFPNIVPEFSPEPVIPDDLPLQTEYLVLGGSIRRYCDTSGLGSQPSFPGYLFQSPVKIATDGRSGGRETDVDIIGGSTIPAGLIGRLLDDGRVSRVDYINDDVDGKGYQNPPDFAPFQLHVGNLQGNSDETDKTFRSSVDLLLLSSVAHLYLEQVSGGDPTFMDKDLYVTASELLGDESLRGRLMTQGISPVLLDIIRPAGPSVGGALFPPDFRYLGNPANLNRFVGRLDFTRFIPRDATSAMVTGALPLATRVVDAFDTITVDSNVPLAQGRININTAPRRVLEALPFLNPRYAAGPIPARNANSRMAESLRAYRDRGSFDMQTINWSSGTRAAVSNLLVGGTSGLRDDATSRGLGVNDRTPGFTTLGELLLATKWMPDNAGGSYKVDPAVSVDESAYRTGHDPDGNLAYKPLNPNGFNTDSNWESTFDPDNDPSEHLALIRAIRNCVSMRSDVFVAYITLVGFTPDDITRAEEPGGTVAQKLTRLQATMEQRYVVVFDRSGVKGPSDRPRVLFAAQEVPSR